MPDDDFSGWRATGVFGEFITTGGGNNTVRGFQGDDTVLADGGHGHWQVDGQWLRAGHRVRMAV